MDDPSTRTAAPTYPSYRAVTGYQLLQDAELARLRADRDWWRRACWLVVLLALAGAGGWAWTVVR